MSVRFLPVTLVFWMGLFICLLLLVACSKNITLVEDVDAREAFVITDVLTERGVRVTTVKGSGSNVTLLVEQEVLPLAIGILRDNGLPRPAFQGFSDLFKQDSMIASSTEEKARLLYITTQKLEQTLSYLDGVIMARVHPAVSEPSSFIAERLPPSASVVIKHRASASLAHLVPDIQRMVANAIAGMSPDNVSVMLLESDNIFRPGTSMLSSDPRSIPSSVIVSLGLVMMMVLGGLTYWITLSSDRKGWPLWWKKQYQTLAMRTTKISVFFVSLIDKLRGKNKKAKS